MSQTRQRWTFAASYGSFGSGGGGGGTHDLEMHLCWQRVSGVCGQSLSCLRGKKTTTQ